MVPRLILILSIILLNFALSNDILKSTSPLLKLQQQSNDYDLNVLNLVLNESLRFVNHNDNASVRLSYNDSYVIFDQREVVQDDMIDEEIGDKDQEKKDELSDVINYFNQNYLFGRIPPFDLTKSSKISLQCRREGAEYLRQLSNLTLWAVKMYDASAKVPSGILNGNINQLGDFDQCININSNDHHEITGKYCLTYLQVEAPNSPRLQEIYRLLQSHFMFRSEFQDPGHRVPRFSSINWATCVPSSCSHKDVEIALQHSIKSLTDGTGVKIKIQVDPEMCQVKNKPIPLSTIFGAFFFFGIILSCIVISLYDQLSDPNTPKNEILMAFSLRRNITTLFSSERAEGDIESVHGIRFLNAFMLIIAHKAMAIFFIPYVNRTEMSEIIGRPWTVIGRAASLYTDPFIMFSGMLTAYSFIGRLKRGKPVNILEEYVSRILRIVPPLAALILFCTFVVPWTGSGPQWNLVVTHHSDICKQYWWRNLLFIHNYFGFENMCLTHTHHVGIDTQLFFVSPLMIWLIWKWPKRGTLTLIGIAAISTVMRYYVTYTMGLSNYVHFGTSIKQLFKTADHMYIIPAHRATVYIIGILFGYILRQHKEVYISPKMLYLGNITAFGLFCAAFFGPAFMGDINYVYEPVHAAWYAAFAPIAWCLSFAWIIFTQHYKYYNFLNSFFSWKGFVVCTRLSYAIYLTQFPIFFYNVGTTRTADHYSFFRIQINLKEYFFIVVFSVILTLLFDLPFQNLRKIIFKKGSRGVTRDSQSPERIVPVHNDKLKDL